MSDQIFYVNSASLGDLSISGSLYSAPSSSVDFSLSTQVSGSFVGTLTGIATSAISASHANAADTAITASYALNISSQDTASLAISASYADRALSASYADRSLTASYVNSGQRIKTGVVNGSSFNSSHPSTYNVVFTTAFPDTLYSVTVTGGDSRTWIVQNLTTSSFTINSNANQKPSNPVFWQAIAVGEFNS